MRAKIIIPVAVVSIVLCALAIAVFPLSGSSDERPILLRHQWVAFVPGGGILTEWDAKRHAQGDHSRGVRRLFSYDQGGDRIPGLGDCTVESYERDAAREDDVPAWWNDGMTGAMVVGCAVDDGQHARRRFTVLEMGCVAEYEFWTMSYNYQMLNVQ